MVEDFEDRRKSRRNMKILWKTMKRRNKNRIVILLKEARLKKTVDDKSRKPLSPDLFFQARQRLFDKAEGSDHETEPGSANEKAKKWPENLLDNTGYNGMLPWDFNDSDSTPKSVSLLVSETSLCEKAQDVFENFPTNLLSGTFPESQCKKDLLSGTFSESQWEEEHLNRISFYCCARCKSDGYKDYEDL